MKMKRIMALVITSAMVMGTLAGCGASTDTTDTTQSQSENNSTAAAATTETASEEKSGTEPRMARQLLYSSGEASSRNTDTMKSLRTLIRNMQIRVYRWNITVMSTIQTETFSWRPI